MQVLFWTQLARSTESFIHKNSHQLHHFYKQGLIKLASCILFIMTGLLVLSHQTAHAKPQNLFFDLDITTQADSNINQAKLKTDIVEDSITSSSIKMGYQFPVSYLSAFTASAGLAAKQFKEVTSQNSKSALFDFSYLWQNEIGYRAPLYQLNFNVEFNDNQTRQQESTIFNTQLLMNGRLTDVISGTLGLGYKYRDSESTVYDLSDARIFASADYALSKKATLYSTLSFISGSTFSVIRPDSDEGIYIALTVGPENIESDDSFNQAYPSQVTDWQVYRIDAQTQTLAFGFNYGFSHGLSVDFSALLVDVTGEAGADYQREILSASLLKRF